MLYNCPAALLACNPASRPQGCDHVLMATGRKPNTEDLGLEQVRAGPSLIYLNRHRRAMLAAHGTASQAMHRAGGCACLLARLPLAESSHGRRARPNLPLGHAVGCMHTDAGILAP